MTDEGTSTGGVAYRVLGSIEAIVDGEPVTLAPMQRKLLALLLIEADKVVSNDRIVDALWGEQPPEAVGDAVRFHISRIRRTLEPERTAGASGGLIVTEHGGYRLAAEPSQIDAAVFEELAQEAATMVGDDPAEAFAILDGALALWQGSPYSDVAYDEFAAVEIRRLEAARLRAIEQRIDLLAPLGRDDEAIAALEALVVEFPLHQGFAEALLGSLNRAGRPADALVAFAGAEERFQTELGIGPPESLRRLEAESRALIEDPAWTDPEHPRHNVPRPITTYVERGREIEEVRERITQRRLVTLLGPGGVGKTRLATEAVVGVLHEYRDGVWFVDLASVADDADVVRAAAQATGSPEGAVGSPIDSLVKHLARSAMLLVFDNCEHVAVGCADLAVRLLGTCPLVRIVATSRAPLGVKGEVIVPVEPLPLPVDNSTLDEACATPSVRLFVDRAWDASGYELSGGDLDAIVAVMTRLAGLPLAIEMAAAQTRSVGPAEITTRLNSHLDFLRAQERGVPDRHQSLAATFRWSYEMLRESEQRFFRRISILSGDFTVDAMAAVTEEEPTPGLVKAVAELVDASLVVRAGTRYRLLEPIREFAAGILEELHETDRARIRHLRFFEGLARSQRIAEGSDPVEPPRIRDGEERTAALEVVGRDIANYRAAFRWALQIEDRGAALEIAAGIGGYLTHHLALRESMNTLESALALDGDAPDGVVVDALLHLSWTQADLGDNGGAEDSAVEALELSQGIGYELGAADALLTLGNAAFERGDLLLALERLNQARDSHVSQDPPPVLMSGLAHLSLYMGDVVRAEEILSILDRQRLDGWVAAGVSKTRGIAASARRDHQTAIAFFEKSVRMCRTERNEAENLRLVAHKHLDLGHLDRAEALASHIHERHLASGVPTYIEKTTNLLGLIALRAGRRKEGVQRILEALEGAHTRGDRYNAWRYLHSAAEQLVVVGHEDEAAGVLRFADDVAKEHQYWLPAIEWVPLVDRASLETGLVDAAAPVEGFEAAIGMLRSVAERS